jgi:RNA polymerase sigma-70 factor (sigma-E family)
MTNDKLGGSGFLSPENDDFTARRFAALLDAACIPVSKILAWNAYPWYINDKPAPAELEAGVEPLRRLLGILPRLRVVMLHGGSAQRGAQRFGWAGRNPRPRSERDGKWLIGTGMATAGYPVALFMRAQRARARLYSDGTAVVQTATQEFGTGTSIVMTQVAADGLGVDVRPPGFRPRDATRRRRPRLSNVHADTTDNPAPPSGAADEVTMLYREHALGLIRLAVVMLGDRPAAEDVVQEAFCGLYRRWHTLADPAKALAYARSSVINGCRSVLRRRRRPLGDLAGETVGESAEAAALVSEEHREVLTAVRRLPDRQREVLVLRFYLDLDEGEIAAALRISRGTVKSTTSRGIAALGRMLGAQS